MKPHYARPGGGLIWPLGFACPDYEVLASRDGVSVFLLANNYNYLGWSDLFTVTPPQGVRDWWATFAGKIGQISQVVEHHRLQSDYANIDFRYESNIGATWTMRKDLLCKLQVSNYRSGDDSLNLKPNTIKVCHTLISTAR